MTGLAPDTTRVWDLQANFRTHLPDAVTLPQLFQKNGYFTARAGKIYHYSVPDDIGTDGMDDKASWNQVVNPNGVDHTREEPLLTVHTPTRGIGSALAFHASAAPDAEHTDGLLASAAKDGRLGDGGRLVTGLKIVIRESPNAWAAYEADV